MNVEQMVYNTIKDKCLIQAGDNIVVGVSGGPDSMALLHILIDFKKVKKFDIVVVHINHGVREKEADKDEEYVKHTCKKQGLNFFSEKVNMNQYAKKRGMTSEEAGREIRYKFFRKIANRFKNSKIAVGHNKDDQAETILMRVIRGSGLDGLQGMNYIKNDVIRPLLGIRREEIEEYCKRKGIKYRIDKTNLKPIYRRNKIRLELIPHIKENYNTNIVNTLCRMSQLVKREVDFLDYCTYKAYEELVSNLTEEEIYLDIKKFNALHFSLKSRVLRLCIEKINGHIKDIERCHVLNIIELVNNEKAGKRIKISNDIKVVMRYKKFIITKKEKDILPDFQQHLEIGRLNYIDILDHSISAEILNKDCDIKFNDRFIKYFDYDKIKGNLYVRNRREGDKFVPFGMNGRKKLKDFFIDEKIPGDKRDSVPLVTDENNIIWVVGYRINNCFKIDKNTKKILKLRYIKDKGENNDYK